MTRVSSLRTGHMIAAMSCGVFVLAQGAASGATYRLSDHPDSLQAPPPYGLRLDTLFAGQAGAAGGVTTFSFVDVIMQVTTSGMGITVNISGSLYGGEDTGVGYGFGEGDYTLDYTYTMNVSSLGTGYTATPDVTNTGTLTALNGDAAGQTFDLFDMADGSGRSFVFLQDDFRLAGSGLEGLGYWVGRGWLSVGGQTNGATRDFLFVATLIPSPLAGSLAGAGLLGLATRRRR